MLIYFFTGSRIDVWSGKRRIKPKVNRVQAMVQMKSLRPRVQYKLKNIEKRIKENNQQNRSNWMSMKAEKRESIISPKPRFYRCLNEDSLAVTIVFLSILYHFFSIFLSFTTLNPLVVILCNSKNFIEERIEEWKGKESLFLR